MRNINDVILYFYNNKKLHNLIRSRLRNKDKEQEFIHFMIEQIIEKDVNYYQDAFSKGQLDYLLIRMMINNLSSKYSRWYKFHVKNDRENSTAIEQFQRYLNPDNDIDLWIDAGFHEFSYSYHRYDHIKIERLVDEQPVVDYVKLIDSIIEELYPKGKKFISSDWTAVEIITRHYKQGMSVKEIAKETSISTDSIYHLLRVFKKAIKNYIYNK